MLVMLQFVLVEKSRRKIMMQRRRRDQSRRREKKEITIKESKKWRTNLEFVLSERAQVCSIL
jgi:adenylate kinase